MFAIIIAAVGLVMYFIATHDKVVEVGRIMFWTGLLAFMLGGGPGVVGGFLHRSMLKQNPNTQVAGLFYMERLEGNTPVLTTPEAQAVINQINQKLPLKTVATQ